MQRIRIKIESSLLIGIDSFPCGGGLKQSAKHCVKISHFQNVSEIQRVKIQSGQSSQPVSGIHVTRASQRSLLGYSITCFSNFSLKPGIWSSNSCAQQQTLLFTLAVGQICEKEKRCGKGEACFDSQKSNLCGHSRELLKNGENEKLFFFFFTAAFKYGKCLKVTKGLLYVTFVDFFFF